MNKTRSILPSARLALVAFEIADYNDDEPNGEK